MHDQALALKALGIPAVTINSETGTAAGGPSRSEVFAGVASGAYAIVFTTPESVPAVLPQLQQLVRDSKLALVRQGGWAAGALQVSAMARPPAVAPASPRAPCPITTHPAPLAR